MIQRKRSARFIAIGVGQGDAFFLERGKHAILVDGGRSTQGFPAQFQRVTKRNGVDILVCTHNDADHACGVLGFLRSGLMCREVWLPGSWTDRLGDLLLRPGDFTRELVSNIKEIEVPRERRLSLQDLGDQYHARMMNRESNSDATRAEVMDPDALSEALETDMETFKDMFWFNLRWWLSHLWYELQRMFRWNYERFSLFVEALTAAALIRNITLAAYHMGASMRWFEYDSITSNGGILGLLEPVNAREVLRMRVRRWSALEFLALTRSNKQSLVFLSPANSEGPAVLFTADSDLSFSQCIPWTCGMIVTAPHHGAEANKNAYQRFARETIATGNRIDVIWVRSDGRFRARPGSWYLNAHGNRFCTLCRGSNHPKQDVRLTFNSGRWRPVFTRRCCCV